MWSIYQAGLYLVRRAAAVCVTAYRNSNSTPAELLIAVALCSIILMGLCAILFIERPLTPKQVAEAAYDCAQYGLGARVTQFSDDGKPLAVECVNPAAVQQPRVQQL